MTVGTTAEEITPGRDFIIQNLGPGNVYFSRSSTVAAAGPGIKLEPGQSFDSFGSTGTSLWVVADAAGTDVRVERF